MVFKTTSTRPALHRRAAGMLLAEALIAIGVTALLVLVICTFSVYSSHSFAALYNYVDLDDGNRIAIDQLTRDVRQSNRVIYRATDGHVLVLEDADGFNITYVYDPTKKTLARFKGGSRNVMLTGCERLSFVIGQRNTVGGSYDVYPAATPATAKVVNVSWLCSRSILGIQQNTESVQTARIVIRKQGT